MIPVISYKKISVTETLKALKKIIYLLVPHGELHHDIEAGKNEHEVKKRI